MTTPGQIPACFRGSTILLLLHLALAGAFIAPAEAYGQAFKRLGRLDAAVLDEVSGIAALADGGFVVHNDDGPTRIYVLDDTGALRAPVAIGGSFLQDWEDLAVVAGPDGPLLAIGDIGDNAGVRRTISIYFVDLPQSSGPDGLPESLPLRHKLQLRYPDGARDAESLAFDPLSNQLLVLTKRDRPPRLYGIALSQALTQPEARLELLGDVPGLRPPDTIDLLIEPFRGRWVSQPTGLDIRPDGRMAALLTYRSLYLYTRADGETWPEAFGGTPLEVRGPPGTQDEAVTFDAGGGAVIVTAEGERAPLYRLPLPNQDQSGSTP